ncbi:hypothetical protein [Winogradskyella sp. 3972H.M.0a.05]|uniref:hypothetical protein n=1 Tax=Winogradskyella sp. 3972H.M.0a.05 TaxID=2950277 RepID=UPI0033969C90
MKKYRCLFLITFLFMSCKDDPKEVHIDKEESYTSSQKLSSVRADLNISVLIDLSDRISPEKYPNPTMNYYERDIGYINSIVEAFETHLVNKKYIKLNDYIQLYLDPEPADKSLNAKVNSLKIGITKDNATKERIHSISNLYDSITTQIYEAAIRDNKFIGSDTWRFFKSKVNDYCIKSGYRNILIVLTDGYVFHKNTKYEDQNQTTYLIPQLIRSNKLTGSNWEELMKEKNFGLIPANQNLDELDVLVLGINPHNNSPFEEDVITAYWQNWLEQMGVNHAEVKGADLPSNMNSIVSKFIWNEN